ncbi:MAG: Nitrilase/cyanide hydratase and apolipoprotein N-acyltransferase [Anaerocolumna sp.]|jgi:predicted amidohydrolase|nr:Nitrilase/cyanide hydratase and apolipoprotein N-acyltransferase [Anaerocolumna sp.]
MKLGLIQTKQNQLYEFTNKGLNLSKEEVIKYRSEMEEQAIGLIRNACLLDCDMIVTSEAVNFCGQQDNIRCDYTEVVPELDDIFFKKVSSLAAEFEKYIVLGAYNRRGENLYNSAIVYNRRGEQAYHYDKIHLAGSENDRLTPGDEYVVMDTEYGRIGLAICWDMQFPECCRELVLDGADLILCPTWGWEQIYGHARAYENGIYVASAMSVPFQEDIVGMRNPSEVISPEGKVLASGSIDRAEVVTCMLDITDCRGYREMRMSDRRPQTYRRISGRK